MKNSILIILMSAIIMACSAPDPKVELDKLKKQKSELETKIAGLEDLIAKTDTSSTNIKRMEVAVSVLSPRFFKSYIEVQARVDADESVSLSSQMPGTVSKIFVKVGDKVNKGDVLAETDARATQQQLAALQTSLTLMTDIYEKQKGLWEQKIGTEVQYLQAKAGKEALESSVSAVQEQLKMSKIISPINGTIDLMNIKIGQAISPAMGVINVVDFSNLKVKADIAESYASKVKIGDEALLYFPDTKDSLVSKVNYASVAISPLSRTFNVEILLDTKKELHPNMVAKLKINDYQSAKPCIVLPVKYIQKTSSEIYTMLALDGVAIKRTITIGREYNGLAEVTSGLNAGDLLITQGYDLVIDGDKVTFNK